MSAQPIQHDPDQTDNVIERHSIDYVPQSERRGKVWHQGPFWFTGNFVILTMFVGFTGPTMGLSVGWSILAIALGASFGTFFMAFHANQGPRMGLPQMIQSRAQFGAKGAVLPFAATVFVYIGFMVFDTIIASEIVQTIAPIPDLVLYPILVSASIVIAVIGHHLLHFVQRWLTYLLIATFGIVTLLAVFALPAEPAALTHDAGWSAAAFFIQFSLAAGYNISYSVYVSDYSRYLPEDAPSGKLIAWTYLGAAGSAIWLMSLGAVLASKIEEIDGVSALIRTGDLLFPGFGTFTVLVGAIALTTIMGVNAYGAMLTGVSAVDGFKPVRPTVRLRVIGLVFAGLTTVIIALAIPENYLDSFDAWVAIMLYFLIPWTSINLVDFYLVRKGRYSISDIFDGDGIYGRWGFRGMLSYIVGFVAMVPFFSLEFYTGPIAAILNGADFSFAVGIAISGGLYYILSRGSNLDAELRVIKESRIKSAGR